MSFINRFLFSALLAPLLAGGVSFASEFEVLDRFSVDGYTVLRGSADIPGGSFSVGGSSFAVQNGKVGIGTANPAANLSVQTTENTDSTIAQFILKSNSSGTLNRPKGLITVSVPDTANSETYAVGGIYGKFDSSNFADTRLTLQSLNGANALIDTLSLKNGSVGIGTTAPGASLNIVSTDTVSTAFKVQTGSISGTEVAISTSGDLNVAGKIKVGNSASLCASDTAGALRWYDGHISVCNGTAWRQLDNQPPPAFASITPASGIISGGTAITITGSGFIAGVEVLVGGAAASVTGVAGSQITATTPVSASTGAKDVKITNTDGQYCVATFTYNPLPTITNVSPASGTQGTVITITGTGFAAGAGVKIGADAATVTGVTATQITAAAPASSASGARTVTVTNSDNGSVVNSSPGFTYKIYATGGTVTSVGGYRIHTFTGSGTFIVVTGGDVEYLLAAGGGSGGHRHAGGGGGGGVLTGNYAATAQSYPITIGTGGANPFPNGYQRGDNGLNTTALGFTAIGGGGGGSANQGTSGGSGGGNGEQTAGAGAAGTSGQGHDGGASKASYGGAGGGGGAGAAGGAGCLTYGVPGNGGDGIQSSISGSAVYYGGGGGGGGYQLTNTSTGGLGGGGAGGNYQTFAPATPGTANTGGGGGGGTTSGTDANGAGGAGGSGIVIIRYPD